MKLQLKDLGFEMDRRYFKTNNRYKVNQRNNWPTHIMFFIRF